MWPGDGDNASTVDTACPVNWDIMLALSMLTHTLRPWKHFVTRRSGQHRCPCQQSARAPFAGAPPVFLARVNTAGQLTRCSGRSQATSSELIGLQRYSSTTIVNKKPHACSLQWSEWPHQLQLFAIYGLYANAIDHHC